MGALYKNTCYATNAIAADQHFLNAGPFYTAGSTSYLAWFEKNVSNVWQIKRQSVSSTGTITNLTTSNATVPTFPTCTESEAFTDGMLIGWGVAGAMVAAFSIKFLARALQR